MLEMVIQGTVQFTVKTRGDHTLPPAEAEQLGRDLDRLIRSLKLKRMGSGGMMIRGKPPTTFDWDYESSGRGVGPRVMSSRLRKVAEFLEQRDPAIKKATYFLWEK